ncbi:hypothetical protein CFI10_11485 [Marinobacterium iners]|uniref:hypothetical protein n=1 Tax=Marinobacterium iners TaxID=48076 RepID=UPI001A8C8783|nr:hypothetical protein [Marinobacterium iners]QSR35611.1 hypothetical protein CFI10_11485 [Marinobacterium iners]
MGTINYEELKECDKKLDKGFNQHVYKKYLEESSLRLALNYDFYYFELDAYVDDDYDFEDFEISLDNHLNFTIPSLDTDSSLVNFFISNYDIEDTDALISTLKHYLTKEAEEITSSLHRDLLVYLFNRELDINNQSQQFDLEVIDSKTLKITYSPLDVSFVTTDKYSLADHIPIISFIEEFQNGYNIQYEGDTPVIYHGDEVVAKLTESIFSEGIEAVFRDYIGRTGLQNHFLTSHYRELIVFAYNKIFDLNHETDDFTTMEFAELRIKLNSIYEFIKENELDIAEGKSLNIVKMNFSN